MGSQASLDCSGTRPLCTRSSGEDGYCSGGKYLFPKEKQTVPGQSSAVATLRWSVETCHVAPLTFFTNAAVEPGVRRSVIPFCVLLDKKGTVVSEIVSGQADEENGICFILDEYDSQATIEFVALSEMSSCVHCVIFGMKSRSASCNSSVSFATNFSWVTNNEIHIYHPSFLGSDVLVIASLTLQDGILARPHSWTIENVSEVIPRGVNVDKWKAYVHQRNKSDEKSLVDSVLMDCNVLRYICEADLPTSDKKARGYGPPHSSDVMRNICYQLGGDEIPAAPNVFPREGGWALPHPPPQPLQPPPQTRPPRGDEGDIREVGIGQSSSLKPPFPPHIG